MEYGIEGYGLYYACVEIIAGNLSTDNITFELEHDAKIMAYKFRMDTLKVEEIMHRCIEYGLFDLAESGHIRCLSLARMLDESTSRNPEFAKLQSKVKISGLIPEKFPKASGQTLKISEQNRIEEKRIEENRKEKKKKVIAGKKDSGDIKKQELNQLRKDTIDSIGKYYKDLYGQDLKPNNKEIGIINNLLPKIKGHPAPVEFLNQKIEMFIKRLKDKQFKYDVFTPGKLLLLWSELVEEIKQDDDVEEKKRKYEENRKKAFEAAGHGC